MQHQAISYQVEEAVRVSGLARSRLYEAMRDGSLRACKIGRRTLIMREDLERFIASVSTPVIPAKSHQSA